MRRMLPLTVALCCAWASQAAAPALRELKPHGAQRGKAFTLTLTGSGLSEGATLMTSLPASFAPLAPREGRSPGSELLFLVELSAQAPVSVYPIRVRTPEGLSNILSFVVGVFPEVVEEESQASMQEYSNDAAAKAQAIQHPVTINGTLRGADQDFYRFQAKKDERVVMEVEARRAGSAVDPLLRVFDSAGQEIARNDDAPGLAGDARVEIAFPADGEYSVAVQDSKFSAQAQNFYRLKIGAFAYADGLFPLGWKRGEKAEVELYGGNLPAPVRVTVDLQAVDSQAGFAMITPPGAPGSLPFLFAVGDRPEALEADGTDVKLLAPSTVVNGKISQPGEVDRYKTAVSPGEEWLVELQNVGLGASRLYGVLTIFDSHGKMLASAGDSGRNANEEFLVSAGEAGVNAHLAFKTPPDSREIIVAVEDLARRGGQGFGYRLAALQQPPDFTLNLITPFVNIPLQGSIQVVVNAERRGYTGPIRLSIPDFPEDLLLEGGHIPGEVGGQTRVRTSRTGTLTITPKPNALTRVLELAVWGEGVLDSGEKIRRRARGPGMITAVRGVNQRALAAPWLNLELPAMVVKERPAALEVVSPRYVRLIQGSESDVEWKFVRRRPDVRPPMRVNGGNVPGIGNLRVLGGKSKEGAASGTLTLVTTVGTPPMKFDMLLDGRVTIDGVEEVITAPAITFEVVQGYTMEGPVTSAVLQPGGKTELRGRLRWQEGFAAPVMVKADNLPPHVSCRQAEVGPQVEEFHLSCEAAPAAAPGEFPIELVSSSTLAGREKESVPYTIPPVTVQLIIPAAR